MLDPSELRQRRTTTVQAFTAKALENLDRPAFRRVAQTADFFPKPKEEFQRTTKSTTIGFVVAFLLLFVLWELAMYAVGRDAYRTELSVDENVNTGVSVAINFDITFFNTPCGDLVLDVMDAAGGLQEDVSHDLYKSPVDRDGNKLYVGKYNYVEQRLGADGKPLLDSGYNPKDDPKSPQFCGKCFIDVSHHHRYDAPGGLLDKHFQETHKDSCCNTCESVMKMYDLHHVPRPNPREVEQCIHELSLANPGCNIRGTTLVRKVKGNIHFAPGVPAIGPDGSHIHSFSHQQLFRFNVSHVVHHFSVGDEKIERFSGRKGSHGSKQPLDGTTFSTNSWAQVRYYLKVVPTRYLYGKSRDAAPDVGNSYEFSAQRHFQPVLPVFGQMPSVFFVFDFYPIQITNTFERPAVGHFLVQICSIVGGLFVMSGLLDRAIDALAKKSHR